LFPEGKEKFFNPIVKPTIKLIYPSDWLSNVWDNKRMITADMGGKIIKCKVLIINDIKVHL